jgi:chemotaxis protein methyltransferase CheR
VAAEEAESAEQRTVSQESLPDWAYLEISRLLEERRGFCLATYKDKCMRRRIAIRMRATGCSSGDQYCRFLVDNPAELDALLRVLTIHVSQFFRNPSTFLLLREKILPAIFQNARSSGREELLFWSVGCASGEEPYTLALILKETFAEELKQFKVSLLATDISDEVLAHAQKGEYVAERMENLPHHLRERYFTPQGGRQGLAAEIRDLVEYRRHDLNSNQAYPAADLIICRNVLIYFERGDQERLLLRFADALKPKGVLVLGKAEILVGESRARFTTLSAVERMYAIATERALGDFAFTRRREE